MVEKMEPIANRPKYTKDKQLQILGLINKAVNFENFYNQIVVENFH